MLWQCLRHRPKLDLYTQSLIVLSNGERRPGVAAGGFKSVEGMGGRAPQPEAHLRGFKGAGLGPIK